MKNIVLMYHDVYLNNILESGFQRDCDLPYKLQASFFEEQVKQCAEYCKERGLPNDTIVFTFDDGGKSFYSVAAPILDKYGYKGVFFISSKYIGTPTFLTEEDIIALHKSGHIIGSHAHSHEHLYELSDDEVEYEWKESIRILSGIIGSKVVYASIPNGDLSKRVLKYTSKHGIKYLYTSEPTTAIRKYKGMDLIGRYVILSNTTTEEVLSIIRSANKRRILLLKRKFLKLVKFVLGGRYEKIKNSLFKK